MLVKSIVKDKCIKYFLIVFILITAIFVFAFTKSRQAYASEKTARDVLIDMGFSDVKDRSEYEYHMIFGTNGGYIVHFYNNQPLRLRVDTSAGSYGDIYILQMVKSSQNGRCDVYSPSQMRYRETRSLDVASESYRFLVYLPEANGYTKEDLLDPDLYRPDGYTIDYNKLYYVSGNTGVVVDDNSMSDLGYEKGSVFFFQGNFTDGSSGSPLAPPDNPPNPGLSDDDKSWFSGLFSGITQTVINAKEAILSGVTSAFEAVGQTIINGIKAIFIPDVDFLNEKIDSVKEKFAFIDSIKDAFDDISSLLSDSNETVPNFTIDLSSVNSKYNYGATAVALDMSWYSSFKPFVDGIIIAFSYISFVFLVFKRAPEIISGSGAVTTGEEEK